MRPYIALSLLSALALAACGGGGAGSPLGGSNPPPGNPGAPASQTAAAAISATNAIGTPLKNFASQDAAVSSPFSLATAGRGALHAMSSSGACNNGVEFFSPDRNNDPNSTETRWFYDPACAQVARDRVRIFSATGSGSENVSVTTQLFAPGNATPIAVRTDSNEISNATFDANGFPIAADGFYRSSAEILNIAGAKTIDSDSEIAMSPLSGSSESFCSDSAGFNATGFAALNKTFGWQSVTNGGTRTPNANGSVTWSSTHQGTDFSGAIGSLSIQSGNPNATCPISTPRYTILGGSVTGTSTLPVTATFRYGILVSLSIVNATLANGNTLNVATNSGVSPTNALFVQGSVGSATGQIASFSTDAFGDGILTVTASGKQFVITDWHVVR